MTFLISTLLVGNIFFLILSALGFREFTVLLGSICFGISCSAIYPLFSSVNKEFEIKMKPDQIANVMFVPILSNMLLTSPIGVMMRWNMDFLFYALTAIAGGIWIIWRLLNREMSRIRDVFEKWD